MTDRFQNLSIRWKLIGMITATICAALLLFTLLSAFMQIRVLRASMFENLTILSESVADMSSAGLSFSDIYQTQEILRTLRADPNIEISVIYDDRDRPFYAYLNPKFSVVSFLPEYVEKETVNRLTFQNKRIKVEIFTPVILDGRRIGTLYLLSNTERLVSYLRDTVLLLLGGMLVIMVVAVLIADYLQRIITRPLARVARMARKIATKGDYSIRVEKEGSDELGQFIDDFNDMVETVEAREIELNKHRHNLAGLVKERTEELRLKRDEALAASQAKSEFLANMSHEIRTPMNGVIGVLSLLDDAPLSEEYRRLLSTASRSADSLLMIIDDILDFSKIDAGMVSFETVVFDLRQLVEEAARLFIDTANSKGLEVVCFIPAQTPRLVKGDPTRLRQILTNLLSNAVKFTDSGVVQIQVNEVERAGASCRLRFAVRDSGIGISEEGLKRVFEKFTQADGSTERKYGGTGLGLSVCRQLVEQQGGSIEAESVRGEGSTFSFTLPFELIGEDNDEREGHKLAGRRFVLIGGTEKSEMILGNYLGACGAELITCEDARSGMTVLQRMQQDGRAVHGVLLDHHMPEFSAFRFAEDIRVWLEGDPPEIILLYSGMVKESQLREAGIARSLLKPVSLPELYAVLIDAVEKKAAGRKEGGGERPPLKYSGKVLLVDDEPINQKVMLAIMEKLGLEAEVVGTGYQAVKLASEREYSVILMDVQMPGMSGLEATERIRLAEEREGRKRTPIIAVTANVLESTRQQCLAVGMDDFVTKPTQPDTLFRAFKPWLEPQVPGEAGATDTDNGQQNGEADGRAWDREKALIFAGLDQELLCELIHLFLERNRVLLENIELAVREEDPQMLRDAAHAYKGAVTHFEARECRKISYDLEIIGKKGDVSGAPQLFESLQRSAARLSAELRNYLEEVGPHLS